MAFPIPRRRLLLRCLVCVGVAVAPGSGRLAEAGAGERSAIASTRVVEVDVVETRGAHGSVVSLPRGIDCEPSCEAEFVEGAEVTLVAGSRRTSRFAGWRGDCVGFSAWCVVVASRPVTVKAQFEPTPDSEIGFPTATTQRLYLTGPRVGGHLHTSAGNLSCPGRCKVTLRQGMRIVVKAFAARGYARQPLWASYPPGICSADTCQVQLTSDVHIAATFRKAR